MFLPVFILTFLTAILDGFAFGATQEGSSITIKTFITVETNGTKLLVSRPMLQLAFRIAIPGFATSVTHVHVMFDLLAFIAHSKHMANVNIFAMNNPGSLV
jgi:hypothetical protein